MKKPITITIMLLSASICFGQQGGGGGQSAPPAQNPPAGGGQQGGGRQQGGQPTLSDRTAPQPPTGAEMPRQIYLSGSVRLSDGTIPPASVVIERVCAGTVRPEAYTDSKGNFS